MSGLVISYSLKEKEKEKEKERKKEKKKKTNLVKDYLLLSDNYYIFAINNFVENNKDNNNIITFGLNKKYIKDINDLIDIINNNKAVGFIIKIDKDIKKSKEFVYFKNREIILKDFKKEIENNLNDYKLIYFFKSNNMFYYVWSLIDYKENIINKIKGGFHAYKYWVV